MNEHASGNALELAPLSKRAVVSLAIFTLILPGFVIISVLAFPSSNPSHVLTGVSVAIVTGIAVALLAFTRRRSVTLNADMLVLRATLYTRRIALADIKAAEIRELDLREHPERRPLLKTNGLAVPGFAAGNFRDRKRNKLFCLVTAPRVVTVPLRDGSLLLVSPAHPRRFIDRLREKVGGLAQR